MANETGTAFLVDAVGANPETLSEREYETIRRYLDMPDGAACQAIEYLLRFADANMGDQETLSLFLTNYGNERHTETIGVLARIFHGTDDRFKHIEDLSGKETELLQWALAAYRAGGWFAEFLEVQLCEIACNPTEHEYHFPAPLHVAANLREFITEHETQIEKAREIARRRPDLVFPSRAESEATPERPAAEQTTQPATTKAAKAPRSRKPRKKVKRAS